MELTILGCNAAIPTPTRNPSAQILIANGHQFLIDCGEGTQFQLRKLHISLMRIEAILISHMHGDHVFGLIGLISTMSLYNRTSPLLLVGPPDLQDFLSPLINRFCDKLSFKISFHNLRFDKPEILQEIKSLNVKSIPLRHRVPTCGFLFHELPKEPNIKKTAIYKYGLSIADIVSIKNGHPLLDHAGNEIPRDELVKEATPPKSFAYISDTAYLPNLHNDITGISLLYHEATFMSDLADLAAKTLHSTARQAAMVAKAANVGKLIIGHFSSRYDETDPLEAEAQQIFSNTTAVYDGFKIVF